MKLTKEEVKELMELLRIAARDAQVLKSHSQDQLERAAYGDVLEALTKWHNRLQSESEQ